MTKRSIALLASAALVTISGFALGVFKHGPDAQLQPAPKSKSKRGGCSDDAELQAKKRAYFAKYAKRQDDGTYVVKRQSVTGAPMTLITNEKGQCLTSHPCASSTADDPKKRTCLRCSDWRNGCSENTDMCCCLPYGTPPRRDKCKCQPPDTDPKGPPTK